jgi:hypothetical protein
MQAYTEVTRAWTPSTPASKTTSPDITIEAGVEGVVRRDTPARSDAADPEQLAAVCQGPLAIVLCCKLWRHGVRPRGYTHDTHMTYTKTHTHMRMPMHTHTFTHTEMHREREKERARERASESDQAKKK